MKTNKSAAVWTTSEGININVSEMTQAHRSRIVNQLHSFASDRKEGYNSPWYKTGKTIGQWLAIVSSVVDVVETPKARPAVAMKRKEKEEEFVMVPVKKHFRKVRKQK